MPSCRTRLAEHSDVAQSGIAAERISFIPGGEICGYAADRISSVVS